LNVILSDQRERRISAQRLNDRIITYETFPYL
jgi:hypothetical protein